MITSEYSNITGVFSMITSNVLRMRLFDYFQPLWHISGFRAVADAKIKVDMLHFLVISIVLLSLMMLNHFSDCNKWSQWGLFYRGNSSQQSTRIAPHSGSHLFSDGAFRWEWRLTWFLELKEKTKTFSSLHNVWKIYEKSPFYITSNLNFRVKIRLCQII